MRCSASSLNSVNREHRASPSPRAICASLQQTPPNGGRRFRRNFTDSARRNRRVGPPEQAGGGPRQSARVVQRRRRGRDIKMIASSVAIAAFEMAKEKHKIAIASGPGVSALTEKSCLPRGIHWAHDTYVLAVGAGQTVASLLGEARNGSSGEFIPGRPIMSNSFHLDQSGDRR